jgi:hypothetical protein
MNPRVNQRLVCSWSGQAGYKKKGRNQVVFYPVSKSNLLASGSSKLGMEG